MADFKLAIDGLLQREGGYVNHIDDPGGETNFGISKRSYPLLDIKGLTREKAAAIYERDYWGRYYLGRIDNQRLANKVFDMVVNMGPNYTRRTLSELLVKGGYTNAPKFVWSELVYGLNSILSVDIFLHALRLEQSEHYSELVARNYKLEPFLHGWLSRAMEV